MIQSRDSLISLSVPPYYHCISRCVRREKRSKRSKKIWTPANFDSISGLTYG